LFVLVVFLAIVGFFFQPCFGELCVVFDLFGCVGAGRVIFRLSDKDWLCDLY
jgi:hypothetical protein